MVNDGWVKIHRSIIDDPVFSNPSCILLFFYLILMANHKDKKILWNKQEFVVKRGELITGRNRLSQKTGLSPQNVRTALATLKSTNKVTIKTYSKFSLITVINYNCYQGNDQQNNQQSTSNQPATNQQLTTNNNDKKEKKDKKGDNNRERSCERVPSLITPQAEFIEAWKGLYRSETSSDYLASSAEYVLIAKKLKEVGLEALTEKAKIFFERCRSRSYWFTKKGMADFNIKNLIANWNSILKSSGTNFDAAESWLRKQGVEV